MSERGMKKWAPYASLIEQKGIMAQMLHNRRKVPRPHLSIDQAEIIDRRLTILDGQPLKITYFDDGFIKTIETIITKVDPLNRVIACGDLTIAYRDLLALEL